MAELYVAITQPTTPEMSPYPNLNEDSSGESLLDVLDGSGLGNGGIGITSGLGGESGGEGGLEVDKEVVLVHVLVSVGSNGGDESGGEFHL